MAKYTYFRLYATAAVHNGSSANYLCIAMLQLFDANGTDFARAEGAVYTADSTADTNSATEKAFNGYPNYRWISTTSASPHRKHRSWPILRSALGAALAIGTGQQTLNSRAPTMAVPGIRCTQQLVCLLGGPPVPSATLKCAPASYRTIPWVAG